jgi:hypothetical protein
VPEPTASELIAYFRGKAQEYERLAKSIEQAANAWPGTVPVTVKSTVNTAANIITRLSPGTVLTTIPPTVENIRKSIQDKGARVADLAQRFGTAESVIREIVSNPENGISIGDRGWLKVDVPRPLKEEKSAESFFRNRIDEK